MTPVRIESSGGNTLILRNIETNEIVCGGFKAGATLADKIKNEARKCRGCPQNSKQCDGLDWVSGTGAFQKGQRSTVGANYCPMKGMELQLELD